MGFLRRRWIWLKRVKHRRGYGVHSPFAFNFITNVVYERGEYYAYSTLKKKYHSLMYYCGCHIIRCRKFLFRLANYVHPSVIKIYGCVDQVWVDYLSAGCESAQVTREDDCNVPSSVTEKSLIIMGEDVSFTCWREVVKTIKTDDSVFLIVGIHDSVVRNAAWQSIKDEPNVFVTFDLYDFGIVFFDSSKQKQHYVVNFN